jgi:hypothetical protein
MGLQHKRAVWLAKNLCDRGHGLDANRAWVLQAWQAVGGGQPSFTFRNKLFLMF